MKSERGINVCEEELSHLRSRNILDIIDGAHNDKYHVWVIDGAFNGLYKSIVLFAIFPTVSGKLELEHAESPNMDISRYLKKIKNLGTSPGLEYVEEVEYENLVIFGDAFLQAFGEDVLADINMPSSVVIFDGSDSTESAYLICPNNIPPSVALRQIQTQAGYSRRNGHTKS